MVDDDFLVTISGPALSLLLYENARHKQIGFLLGEILNYVTKKVTDTERDIEHIKQHINIKTVMAYPIGEPFFNTAGYMDQDKLKNFLNDNAKKVVGWYHYRSSFDLKPTVRDESLHNDLSSFFSKINKLQNEENFIIFLLTSSVSDIGGTHKFKHLLMRKLRTGYKPVQLKINNLGADATRPDGSDYKPTPTESSSDSDAFDKVYEQVKKQLENVSGVQAVTLIQKAAERFLKKLIPEVSRSDQRVSELEQKLGELRSNYYEKILLECQMQHMEIQTKSDITEPKTPEPLEICDSPKSHTLGSNVKEVKKKFKKQQNSIDEQMRDNSSSEQELMLTPQEKESQTCSNSNECSLTRESARQTRISSNSKDTSQRGKNRSMKTSSFIQESVAASKQSDSNSRSYRRSPDHKTTDS